VRGEEESPVTKATLQDEVEAGPPALPRSRAPRVHSRLLLFLAGAALFFALRGFDVEGGDTCALLDVDRFPHRWGKCVFNVREPLAHLLVLVTFKATKDINLAFALVSSLCGGIWLVLLSLFPRQRPIFWLTSLVSVIPLMFIGHREFYAPILCALTALFLLLACSGDRSSRRVRPWHVLAVWGVAVLAHKLAFFYLPALVPLVADVPKRRFLRLPRDEWRNILLTTIAVSLALQFPFWLQMAGNTHVRVIEHDNRILELLTLPKGWADAVARRSPTGAFQLFYFGSGSHFLHFFGFLLAASPLGVPLALARWRRALAPAFISLAIAAVCSLIWTFMWHPHMAWRDWDLFCTAGLPINLLAGLLWSRGPREDETAKQG
jgi:hypothetical protein